MELRHLRYFVAVGEEQHFGRAAARLHVAQPALSRQIQDLERELGYLLLERLPRGVKLTSAGKVFLDDVRRILQEVENAGLRAGRIAKGKVGVLRIGFLESISWRGIVPDSFRKFRENQPDAELEVSPQVSFQQLESIRSGKLDGGFILSSDKPDEEFASRWVGQQKLILAAPQGHPLTRLKRLRLRDLKDTPMLWIHRTTNPVFHDRLLHACIEGGLTPRIVQQAHDSATLLSLVSCRLGVTFVAETTRWNRPPAIALRPIIDLNLPLPFYFIWKKGNTSPLLQRFIAQVQALAERRD